MRHHHFAAVMVAAAMSLALAVASNIAKPESSQAARRPMLTIGTLGSPESSIVVDGQDALPVAVFTLRAGREDILIDTLTLQNCITERDADGDCADGDETAGDDAVALAVEITYLDDAGEGRRVAGTLSENIMTFTELRYFLPRGKAATLEVFVDTGTIDDLLITSGMQLQINLNARAQAFHATTASGDVLTERTVAKNATTHVMTLRKTQPTIVGTTAEQSLVMPSIRNALEFVVTVDEAGGVDMQHMMFAFEATDKRNSNWNACNKLGADSENFTLTNMTTGANVDVTWAPYNHRGTACAGIRGDVTYLSGTFLETLAAGTVTTYALFVDGSRASTVRHDTLRTWIPSEEDLAEVDDDWDAVQWSDGTATGTTIDATGVKYLPLEGTTIMF